MQPISGENILAVLNTALFEERSANGFRPRFSRLPSESLVSLGRQIPNPEPKRSKPISESLHKRISQTKLCIHHAKGNCVRGERCSFAHSERELREPPDLYKTRLCLAWISTQNCSKGSECIYAHGEHELRWTSEFYKTSLCPALNTKTGCLSGDKCRYAHSAQELRKQATDEPDDKRNTGCRQSSVSVKKPADGSDIKLEDITNWRTKEVSSSSLNLDEASGNKEKSRNGELPFSLSHLSKDGSRSEKFTAARTFPSLQDMAAYDPYDTELVLPQLPDEIMYSLINSSKQEMAFAKELSVSHNQSISERSINESHNPGFVNQVAPIFDHAKFISTHPVQQRSSESKLCDLSRETLRSLQEEQAGRKGRSFGELRHIKSLEAPPGLTKITPSSSRLTSRSRTTAVTSQEVNDDWPELGSCPEYARLVSMWTAMTAPSESDLSSPRSNQFDDEHLELKFSEMAKKVSFDKAERKDSPDPELEELVQSLLS